jgi:hypothetical protein
MNELWLIPAGLLAIVCFWWLDVGSFRPRRIKRILALEPPAREPPTGFLGVLYQSRSRLWRLLKFAGGAMYCGVVGGVVTSLHRADDWWRVPASAFSLLIPVAVVGLAVLFLQFTLHLHRVARERPRLLPRVPLVLRVGMGACMWYATCIVVGVTIRSVLERIVS